MAFSGVGGVPRGILGSSCPRYRCRAPRGRQVRPLRPRWGARPGIPGVPRWKGGREGLRPSGIRAGGEGPPPGRSVLLRERPQAPSRGARSGLKRSRIRGTFGVRLGQGPADPGDMQAPRRSPGVGRGARGTVGSSGVPLQGRPHHRDGTGVSGACRGDGGDLCPAFRGAGGGGGGHRGAPPSPNPGGRAAGEHPGHRPEPRR